MNREQAINYLFSSGFTNEQVCEVVRALTYEPTTKNNTVDFNKINELADFAIKATGQRDSYSQGMCNGIEYLRASLMDTEPKYFDSNDEYKDSATKNNLGVDCISRADAIKAMQNKANKLKNEDTINGLCGAVAILYELPSVTPQEPRKGYLSIDDVMSVFDDFMCGEVDEDGTETFLEMLKDKADMREVEE